MKTVLYLSVVLLSCALFFGCKSDNVTGPGNGISSLDTGSFTYPFNIGNTWSYTRKIYASDIHPDSILHYFSGYPLTWNGTVTILYDTLINGIQTRCFLEVMSDAQRTYQSRSYLINNDTALLLYAQMNGGFLENPPDNINNSVKFKLDFGTDESIHINNPPYVLLKYPVVTGKTWQYIVSYTPPDTIVKKYEGYELIVNGSGSFNCMKTSATYSLFPESPYFDFYCRYGLLKRTVFFDNAIITNEWYPEGIGTADLTETFTVNSFNIH